MATRTLLLNTDNVVRVLYLADAITGAYIASATIQVTLYDSTGAAVTGGGPITLAADVNTPGNYAGTIPNSVALTDRAMYYLLVEINAGAGAVRQMKVPVQAVVDRG